MDKTQTPPGRDGGDKDAGKKQYYGKPVKAKDAADDTEKELNKAMDNAHKKKARKMYELADRLSKVDTSKLNEQQAADRTAMIKRLGEELKSMQSSNDIEEANSADGPHYNIAKLGGAIGTDPRLLRMAIARGMAGKPTRQDLAVLADSFLKLLQNSDDRQIQAIANLIKAGNPREVPQESTAAIAERNAFVDAMRQAKKGEKFTVGGKEYTKTTAHGDEDKVEESISTEAYDRLKRVFDFSDYKG